MRTMLVVLSIALSIWAGAAEQAGNAESFFAPGPDEFSYLENAGDARMQVWVEKQNARALAELEADPRFERFRRAYLDHAVAAEREDSNGLMLQAGLAWLHRDWIYQIAKSSALPRGVLRAATLRSYLARKPAWRILVDADALSLAEGKDWALGRPDFAPSGRRCLIALHLGDSGSLIAHREFDLERREFVRGGFELPAVRQGVAWRDDDTLIVAAATGPDVATAGGAPLLVKRWRRGQSLESAPEIFRGRPDDAGIYVSYLDNEGNGGASDTGGVRAVVIARRDRRGHGESWLLDEDELAQLHLPSTRLGLHRGHCILRLQEDWQSAGRHWRRGSIVSVPLSDITSADPKVFEVFTPPQDSSILNVTKSRSGLLLRGTYLAYGRLWRAQWSAGQWRTTPVDLPQVGNIALPATDIHSDHAFVTYSSYLTPNRLYRIDVGRNKAIPFYSPSTAYDPEDFSTELWWARSADGVEIPYSIVRSRRLPLDGTAPTIVLGYGASGGTQSPWYLGPLIQTWLEPGGVYVTAHIRGGLERGSLWHVRGLGRQHTYDDMIAVTEDLIRRKVSSAKRIGFTGYSNGGLLGGVMLTQRQDLFGAVVLKAPHLDQFRQYLSLGIPPEVAFSETGEYGPIGRPDVRAFISRTSPFQNLRPGTNVPRPLLLTSTTDTQVHPAQARRFAAKMESLKMPFLFYETAEGGHGLFSTREQHAHLEALILTYLSRQLIDPYSPAHP